MKIKIREADLRDAEDIAIIHQKVWQTTYRGLFPDEKLDNYSIKKATQGHSHRIKESQTHPYKILVAENFLNKLVGFAIGGKFDKTPPFDCEIATIYILKDYQRKGIGSLLVARLLEFFRSQKWESMIIWTLAANLSRNFYEKLGGTPTKQEIYEKWGCCHKLLGYTWKNIKNIKNVKHIGNSGNRKNSG